MTVAINTQLLNNIQECDVIPNLHKVEKKVKKLKERLNYNHAQMLVSTAIAHSDDKLTREQVRRANQHPRKITHKTVEAREFMGIYN